MPSTGGSNWAEVIPGIISKEKLCEHFCWRPESEHSRGPIIYLVGHGLKVMNVTGDLGAFREILPDYPVGVLVGSPLPRGMRVREIHRDIRCKGQGGMISRDTTDGFRLIAAAMPICCICAARQREISSLSANVSISRRTLPPIHSRVRQSLSLKGNPSHGDPIRRVGRAGRSGRDKPDDRGSVGTSAQRALPWPHSRPPGPGPRRASRRHHAPPIWRVGVEQQYIAAG